MSSVLVVLACPEACASITQWEFSGYVSGVRRRLDIAPAATLGDPVTGRFAYDTAGEVYENNAEFLYVQQRSPLQVSISVAGYEFQSDGDFVAGTFHLPFDTTRSNRSFYIQDGAQQTSAAVPGPSFSGDTILRNGEPVGGYLYFAFDQLLTADPTFDVDELPTQIDFSTINNTVGEIQLRQDAFGRPTRAYILFEIESVQQVVPEPTAAAICVVVVAVGAVGYVARLAESRTHRSQSSAT